MRTPKAPVKMPLMWRSGAKRTPVKTTTNKAGFARAVKPEGNGCFQLRYWHDGKLHYENLKTLDPAQVLYEADALRRKIVRQLSGAPKSHSVNSAAASYLVHMRKKHPPAAKQLEYTFRYLLPLIGRLPLGAVIGRDVERFHEKLKAQGMADRTVKNHHVLLKAFFNHFKITVHGMPKAPKHGKTLLTIVEENEMQRLLTYCREHDKYALVLVELARQTGLRKRELMFSRFDWIRWQEGVLQVREDSEMQFTTKTRVEREIPLSDPLLALLKEWQESRPWAKLIFETRTHKAPQSLINRLKRAVTRAGLDPAKFSLHMMRRYFVSESLHRGVDIETTRDMAGHSSVTVTGIYARPMKGKALRDKMNDVWQ
jgi:integrase